MGKKKNLPPPDILDQLMDSCRRNKRPAVFPARKQEKIYFDADRFRWLFGGGLSKLGVADTIAANPPWKMERWRQWMDDLMRESESEAS